MTDTANDTPEHQVQSEPAFDSSSSMRLRAELPRVTRLSRKVLASAAAVALVGIGGSLIYALQTRDPGKSADELNDQMTQMKKEQFNLRFQRANGQVENTGRIRTLRRSIARIQTVLTEQRAAQTKD